MSQTAKEAFRYSSIPDAQVFGLYFSANYCKLCRNFTPKLTELYLHLRERGLKSCWWDQTKRRRRMMPTSLNNRGRPSVSMMTSEGNVVNRDGRSLVNIAAINENNHQTVEWVASQVGVGSPFRYDSGNSDF
ncbi:hypothetical protein PC128_g16566 [Phytophthora cactorum]|nr:hypothetical protein PC128_g16566 [Phytophthora cactorum]